MDYSLAAVKVLISQLKPAKEVAGSSGVVYALGSLIFQRAWLQGVLVRGSDEESLLLDDGSGVLQLVMDPQPWTPGMYVLVVGAYMHGNDGTPLLKVHKIVDLSSFPNRAALWQLEVTEAHHLFYKKLMNVSPH